MRLIVYLKVGVLVTTLVSLLQLAFPTSSYAAVGINQQLSFEGKIVTAAGLNIADGTYNMEFTIYTATGGCNPVTLVNCTASWTEDWLVSAGNGVAVTSGTYQVNLDSVVANNFAGIDFNSYPLYLSLQIGNTSNLCAPAGNFQANCGGDGVMKPLITLTASPYALNSNALQGLNASAFGQLASSQTWTQTNTYQPSTNITGLVVKQTSNGTPSADIFNVQSANNSNLIQITGPSANSAAVNINSLGANAITLNSGGALTFTGAANSTWDVGASHTLAIQTVNNGAITTGSGLLTVGGNLTFSGASALVTGPGGGLTVNVNSGPLALTTTTSGAITITANASSVWSTNTGTLTLQSASGSAFSASAVGTGQSNFGTLGTGTVLVGNTSGSSELQGPLYGSSTAGVLVGTGVTTATPLLLELNNATLQGAETAANCTTTVNSGALYYNAATVSNNTTTNEVRGCIDGKWTDVVTGDQLGILLFGVEQMSGTSIGDITGLSGYTNAPCKVAWASATSVTVAPCTAYSGGRKVVINAAVTISGLGQAGSVTFQHICLTGTNGSPQASAANTSETAAVPAFNAATPILCLATVKSSTTPAITNIYDTRVFTTSVKAYAAASVAVAPGFIVIVDTTGDNIVKSTSTSGASNVRGVVAVGNSAGSTANVNSIIIVGGPAFVKGTGTVTVGQSIQTSTTAGYARTIAITSSGPYKDLGQTIGNGNTSGCSSSSNCQFSLFTDVAQY